MAMDNAENLSLVLVRAGAKRVLKDLVYIDLNYFERAVLRFTVLLCRKEDSPRFIL
jgi:hypothetical protein